MSKITLDLSGLERLRRNAQGLGGSHHVPLDELFPPAFMRGCSGVRTFEELLDASPFTVRSAEDFKAIPDAEWDAHVRQNTRYSAWQEMRQAAVVEWTKAQLFR